MAARSLSLMPMLMVGAVVLEALAMSSEPDLRQSHTTAAGHRPPARHRPGLPYDSRLTPGSSQAYTALRNDAMASYRVKLRRHASTTRRMGGGPPSSSRMGR